MRWLAPAGQGDVTVRWKLISMLPSDWDRSTIDRLPHAVFHCPRIGIVLAAIPITAVLSAPSTRAFVLDSRGIA